jgi:hypothetical protein
MDKKEQKARVEAEIADIQATVEAWDLAVNGPRNDDIVADLRMAERRFRQAAYERFMQERLFAAAGRLSYAATAPTPLAAHVLEACGLDPKGVR